MSKILVHAIRTPIYKKGLDLSDFIFESSKNEIRENTILAVTSKLVSIGEERFASRDKMTKKELIEAEAENVLCDGLHGVSLTIKHGLLIPSAGIDESNSENGDYILYPKDPFASARRLCQAIKEKLKLKNFGIILTDSHTHPLRRGVTGIALAYDGFFPCKNLIGEPDLYGRKMKMTSVNVVDSLAVAAVFVMGEAAEQQPLALIETNDVVFTDKAPQPEDIRIPLEEDLYGPLIAAKK